MTWIVVAIVCSLTAHVCGGVSMGSFADRAECERAFDLFESNLGEQEMIVYQGGCVERRETPKPSAQERPS